MNFNPKYWEVSMSFNNGSFINGLLNHESFIFVGLESNNFNKLVYLVDNESKLEIRNFINKWKDRKIEIRYENNVNKEAQEWFINYYPEFINRINELDFELKNKYSHLMMSNKFELFNEN
jgi:hypothetical protein